MTMAQTQQSTLTFLRCVTIMKELDLCMVLLDMDHTLATNGTLQRQEPEELLGLEEPPRLSAQIRPFDFRVFGELIQIVALT